jgi:hypothetical protein
MLKENNAALWARVQELESTTADRLRLFTTFGGIATITSASRPVPFCPPAAQ